MMLLDKTVVALTRFYSEEITKHFIDPVIKLYPKSIVVFLSY